MSTFGDDIRPRDIIEPAPRPRDRQDPYLYDVTIRLVVKGDGQHSDGRGAVATLRELCAALSAHEQVTTVQADHPTYRGPNA